MGQNALDDGSNQVFSHNDYNADYEVSNQVQSDQFQPEAYGGVLEQQPAPE